MRELLAKIEALYKEMMIYTHAAGVSTSLYDSVIKADGNLTLEILQDRLTFLEKVRLNEYDRVRYLYELVPPEAWTMYKLLGEHNFPEQIELNKARKALKKEWVKKYARHKNTDWEPVVEVEVRSKDSERANVNSSEHDTGLLGTESN